MHTHEIEEKLSSLRKSETPIVIRDGLTLMNMNKWRGFLSEQCGLIEDRRHYDSSGSLQSSDWWEISYQPEKSSSYAYSKTLQPLHTDNAWFQDPAQVNFFVMYKQARSGGEQMILPLSRLLDTLTANAPELLNDLCSIPVVIKKGDGQFENHTTIIRGDKTSQIFWNYYRTQRDSNAITDMCEAFFVILSKLMNTSIVDRLHCASGDCFAFNDTLLLHGRHGFEANSPRDRVLYQSMWRFPTI